MLSGQTALITGASRGVGRHLALKLADAGMNVGLCARSEGDLQGVAAEVAARGGTAQVYALDVRDTAAIRACVRFLEERFGAIDVLVNNAGLSPYKPLVDWTPDEIDTVLDVNLKGLIHLTQAVLPGMMQRRRGQIINMASDVGRRAIPNMGPYVAAKHGVVGFSGSILREVKDYGIRVSVLLPGVIDTYFGGGAEGSRDPASSMTPAAVADVIHHLLTQPAGVVLDEVQLHPLGQEF
ncbi:MAG: SDR family oxidoreductase [Bacteroidota bacterium]